MDICRELLSVGASPLTASTSSSTSTITTSTNGAGATNVVHQLGETAIDLAMRLRLWDVAALFISSGKAGTVISAIHDEDNAKGTTAAATSTATAQAKTAAGAAELIDAASAGRVDIVTELLLNADGAVLSHQMAASISASSRFHSLITPIHAILAMSQALRENISNISSILLSALVKISRTSQHHHLLKHI